jgi:hypothetical protein
VSKARTAMVALRLPWLYREGEGRRGAVRAGETGLVGAEQFKLMRKRVKRAIREGEVAKEHGERELREIKRGIRIIESGRLDDVGVWVPADQVVRPRARRR